MKKGNKKLWTQLTSVTSLAMKDFSSAISTRSLHNQIRDGCISKMKQINNIRSHIHSCTKSNSVVFGCTDSVFYNGLCFPNFKSTVWIDTNGSSTKISTSTHDSIFQSNLKSNIFSRINMGNHFAAEQTDSNSITQIQKRKIP